MTKPPYVQPTGVHTDPMNRFTHDFAKNPSPQRTSNPDLYRQTEGVPVICRWCSGVFWPPMDVREGVCSDQCAQDEQTYRDERAERNRLMEALQTSEIDLDVLRAMAGKGQTV